MRGLRRYFVENRRFVAAVFALALLLRALFPAGFMPVAERGGITVEFCTGHGVQTPVVTPADAAGSHDGHNVPGDKSAPCGFGALLLASLSPTDIVLLAIALAFVIAAARLAVVASVARTPAFLRPPLRAPPLNG